MPTASAMSDIEAAWYPRSLKIRVAASMMSGRTPEGLVSVVSATVASWVLVAAIRSAGPREAATPTHAVHSIETDRRSRSTERLC